MMTTKLIRTIKRPESLGGSKGIKDSEAAKSHSGSLCNVSNPLATWQHGNKSACHTTVHRETCGAQLNKLPG